MSSKIMLFGINNNNLKTCAVAAIVILISLVVWNRFRKMGVENFVAHNNDQVREMTPYGLIRDDNTIKHLFDQVVSDDAGKFSGKTFSNFKQTNFFEDEIKGIINYVLKRINVRGGRKFAGLDFQSAKKESTLDPSDRRIINRWFVQLFIHEKSKSNVHGWATNIAFELLQKDNMLKITKLYTITDHYYKKDSDSVEGMNPYDKYYKLENPFHLNKPWETSGRVDGKDVLMTEEESERLLDQWHKDLKDPQYRCFVGTDEELTLKEGKGFFEQSGDRYRNKNDCSANDGTWDKPVESDAACPFYRQNLNYINRLGGVKADEQRCEMPINTKTVGYRFVTNDPRHKPWCYNCKVGVDGAPGSWGPCCEEQLDKELYPNLASPDYAFPGDELERGQHWEQLAERGLHWQRFPTNIRDITNQNQKQPVFNALVGGGPGHINLP